MAKATHHVTPPALCAVVFAAFLLAANLPAQSTPQTSVPLAPSAGAAHDPASGTRPEISIEILSDTRGVDFGPYVKNLLRQIRTEWTTRLPSAANLDGTAVLRFTINPDGKIASLHLDSSSHQESIDRAAWGTLTSIGAFPPLPAGFSGPGFEVRMPFVVRPITSAHE